MKVVFAIVGLVGAVALAPQQARQQESCDLEVQATQGWMRADSVSSYQARGVTYLFGNVQYRDPGRSVNAERATYYQLEDWVRAEGNVEVTDQAGRSRLTAPALDYYPPNSTRETERIVAHYRPHLTFFADSAGGAPAEPFEVDAERMHIYRHSDCGPG
jgi:hypothetical protein